MDSSNRQYEGFNYPISYPSPAQQQVSDSVPGQGASSGAMPLSGNMVRRTTSNSTTGNSLNGAPNPSYGYFHRHTSSNGGYSGAMGSESGSTTSNPMYHLNRSSNPARGGYASPVAVRMQGDASSIASGGQGQTTSVMVPSTAAASAPTFLPPSAPTTTTSVAFLPPPVPQPTSSSSMMPQAPYRPQPFIPAGSNGSSAYHQGVGAAPAAPQQRGGGGGGFLRAMFDKLLQDDDAPGGGAQATASHRAERPLHQVRFGCPDDDLPLLEELGVRPAHIWQKATAVLNPLKEISMEASEDTDLAGPIVFAASIAVLLSLQGKIQFSAIYGLSVTGVLFFKALLALLTDSGASLQLIISSLGYALLPSLVLAILRTVQLWVLGANAGFLLLFAFIMVAWSSWCATSLLVKDLSMEPQRYLLLYPVSLFYAIFAVMTLF